MNLSARLARRPFYYGWIVAGVTFLTLLAAAGVRAAPGILMVPLGHEFDWTGAEVSTAVSINLVLYGLVGPFAAALYQRIGLRRTMLIAVVLLSAGFALTVFVHHVWQLALLWGVVVGLGSGATATVLGATVANRWFTARRGLVMGILTASTATGQLVFLPLLASVVVKHGWRQVPLITAGAALLVFPLIWIFMRDDPAEVGLRPYGAEDDTTTPRTTKGAANPAVFAIQTLVEATKSRDFWLLAGTFFICGASTNGLIGTHLVPAALDCGIPGVRAASLLAMMGIFDLFGTTASGCLSDRYSSRLLLFFYYGFRWLSLMFLPTALLNSSAALTIFGVFYGLDRIATVPPTVRLTADAFGKERAGIVFGWVVAAHQLGAAFAAFSAAFIRPTAGNYRLAFLSSGALCLVAALAALSIGRKRTVAIDVPIGATAS